MIKVTPVILCGGSGTRLWPLSRTGFPKQFLCLTGNESLFQQAAQRLASLDGAGLQVASPLIVTGEDHRFLASEQLREIGVEMGYAQLEPLGRNTAPALTLAALAARAYLEEGGYYWNTGMFVLKASVWLKALEEFCLHILDASGIAWSNHSADALFVRPGRAEFSAIPSESVDYAVMERCPGSAFPIKMVPLDAGWNDLGAWERCCQRMQMATPMWAMC